MNFTTEEIKSILNKHEAWLADPLEGGRADLSGADLSGADIDFACWPLWCGSKGVKVDRRIAAQFSAHFCVLDCDDPDYIAARNVLLGFAKTSHRAEVLGLK